MLKFISKIIFSEKSLSVHMSVRLSRHVTSRPRPRPPQKSLNQKMLLNKVARYTTRVTKIHLESCYSAERGEAELRIYNLKATLPPQNRSQAVVCVSTPRLHQCSGYCLVISYFIKTHLFWSFQTTILIISIVSWFLRIVFVVGVVQSFVEIASIWKSSKSCLDSNWIKLA